MNLKINLTALLVVLCFVSFTISCGDDSGSSSKPKPTTSPAIVTNPTNTTGVQAGESYCLSNGGHWNGSNCITCNTSQRWDEYTKQCLAITTTTPTNTSTSMTNTTSTLNNSTSNPLNSLISLLQGGGGGLGNMSQITGLLQSLSSGDMTKILTMFPQLKSLLGMGLTGNNTGLNNNMNNLNNNGQTNSGGLGDLSGLEGLIGGDGSNCSTGGG